MKRLVAATAIALVMSLGGIPAASAVPSVTDVANGDWACIAFDALDLGICQGNPLPHPGD